MLVDEVNRAGMEGCFSKGDGTTTFRLLEIRGEFLRVFDNNRGKDANRVSGSAQAYAIEKIIGEFGVIDGGSQVVGGAFKKDSTNTISHVTSNTSGAHPKILFDSSLVVNSAEETRPRNIAYPAYIKII